MTQESIFVPTVMRGKLLGMKATTPPLQCLPGGRAALESELVRLLMTPGELPTATIETLVNRLQRRAASVRVVQGTPHPAGEAPDEDPRGLLG